MFIRRSITLIKECKHTTSIRLTRVISWLMVENHRSEHLSDFSDEIQPAPSNHCASPSTDPFPNPKPRIQRVIGRDLALRAATFLSDFSDATCSFDPNKIWLTKQPFFYSLNPLVTNPPRSNPFRTVSQVWSPLFAVGWSLSGKGFKT